MSVCARILPALLLAWAHAATGPTPTAASAGPEAEHGVPRFDHVVIVVMENHAYSPILGNPKVPYINALATQGARFDRSYAVAHPSQPNYLALFSGSTQGVVDDSCPIDFHDQPNLGSQLLGAKLSFTGYSEDLPNVGFIGCGANKYRRKHNPWVAFRNVPAASNRPFTDFPSNFSLLPTVSFVVPDMCNDMHDCAVQVGDEWLRKNIDAYAQWAKTHNSLLILTFDEDDDSEENRIPTLFVGDHVAVGSYAERIDHYRVLRTLQAMYGLEPAGLTVASEPITGVWLRGKAATSK